MRRVAFLFLVLIVGLSLATSGCYVKFPKIGGRLALRQRVIVEEKGAKDKILVVPIRGIIRSSRARGLFYHGPNTVEQIGMQLQKASRDKRIKGIILTIDSPGGEVTGSDIIYHRIIRYKKEHKTPVVALMGSVAASGGLYVAMAADEIVAHPSTVTGSIGVLATLLNIQGLLEKIGVRAMVLKKGEMKDMGSSLRPISDEERNVILGILNEFYELFLDRILESRKHITREELLKIADGRVFTAKQALQAKLVDRIGQFEDATAEVKRLAGITKASVVTYDWDRHYRYDPYSALAPKAPVDINLFKLDLGSLQAPGCPGFYYLWTQ